MANTITKNQVSILKGLVPNERIDKRLFNMFVSYNKDSLFVNVLREDNDPFYVKRNQGFVPTIVKISLWNEFRFDYNIKGEFDYEVALVSGYRNIFTYFENLDFQGVKVVNKHSCFIVAIKK